MNRRSDAALFEEVLWQTAEEGENELADNSAVKTDADKSGLSRVIIVWAKA